MPDQTTQVCIYHKELVDLIANKCSMSTSSINSVLTSFAEVLDDEVLKKGKRLRINSVGVFQRNESLNRKKKVTSSAVSFTPSNSLKLRVQS
jgi:nucleoid DNA-binding protein